jgi:hypothetical protein
VETEVQLEATGATLSAYGTVTVQGGTAGGRSVNVVGDVSFIGLSATYKVAYWGATNNHDLLTVSGNLFFDDVNGKQLPNVQLWIQDDTEPAVSTDWYTVAECTGTLDISTVFVYDSKQIMDNWIYQSAVGEF